MTPGLDFSTGTAFGRKNVLADHDAELRLRWEGPVPATLV